MDLDLFSLFPSNRSKNHGGIERGEALRRSTMEGKNELKEWGTFGEEGPLNRASRNLPVMHRNDLDRSFRPKFPAIFRPGHQRDTPHLSQLEIFSLETSVRKFPARSGDSGLRKLQKYQPRKRTYLDHPNSVFDDLGLVGITATSSTRSCRETSW